MLFDNKTSCAESCSAPELFATRKMAPRAANFRTDFPLCNTLRTPYCHLGYRPGHTEGSHERWKKRE